MIHQTVLAFQTAALLTILGWLVFRCGIRKNRVMNSITWNEAVFWKSKVVGRLAQISAVVLLVAMALGPAGFTAQAMAVNVQPDLVKLAAQSPDQTVDVIVQKARSGSDVESLVGSLGGTVTQDLHIINSFAASLTAKSIMDLARSPEVRWVSIDTPTRSSNASNPVFVTWATTIGTQVENSFYNSGNMIDSSVGPNGTYGVGGGGAKGSFSGFEPQLTPDAVITKVEVVVQAFRSWPSNHQVKFQAYVGGTKVVEVRQNPTSFYSYGNWVYVDITGGRQWLWEDLANDFQIGIDQTDSGFGSMESVLYDAVGLRVTSSVAMNTTLSLDPNVTIDSGGDPSALAPLDATVQGNVFNQVVRAADLWDSNATLQGKNTTVAVVDSGVSRTRDLGRRVRANVNFNASYHDSADRYGHGTFVAGIIAGNGLSSGGKYTGVAPRADILNIRVSDDQGMASEADVIAALQWVNDHRSRYNIRVVNLSLNLAVPQSYLTSPLDAAVEILWFNGVVVVTAVGNNGDQTIYPPANDPFVITVGATDDRGTVDLQDDAITGFSAYGVTEDGFSKPDLVAPGKRIIGLLPNNDRLTLGMAHPENRVDRTYFMMSGTSVSAPIVSGAVALLLQDEPNLTPDQVKYRLMANANKTWPSYSSDRAGAGYLDVLAAVNGSSLESANSGIIVSSLLTTGNEPVNSSVSWNSVSWNSVSWNSVSWNSVSWNSVSWNSVSWNSDYWGN